MCLCYVRAWFFEKGDNIHVNVQEACFILFGVIQWANQHGPNWHAGARASICFESLISAASEFKSAQSLRIATNHCFGRNVTRAADNTALEV